MAATIWSAAPYIQKQDWLLADGSIVTSPDFEATGSGRKVRVTGTTISTSNKQVDSLIIAAIDRLALDKGTTRLLRIFDFKSEQSYRASVCSVSESVFTDAAQLHINMDSDAEQNNSTTILMWNFECTTLPIGASIFLVLTQRYGMSSVSVRIAWRSTDPTENQTNPVYANWDGNNLYLGNRYRHSDQFRLVEQSIENNGGILPGVDVKQASNKDRMRTSITDLAVRAKSIDALDEILLPDLRDQNCTFLTFKRKSTNYSANVYNEILALVQTGPLLEQIQTSYTTLVSALKALGIVITGETPSQNDFAKAATGDLSFLKVKMKVSEDENVKYGDGVDRLHEVVLDLVTGSVIVNCTNEVAVNDVADAWNIAKFKADVMGETDLLLAYAEAYRHPKEQARIRKIISQRTTPDTL